MMIKKIILCLFICSASMLGNTDSIIKSNHLEKYMPREKVFKLLSIIEDRLNRLDINIISTIRTAEKISIDNHITEFLGDIYLDYGKYWKYAKDYHSSTYYIFRAITIYEKEKNLKKLAMALIYMAESYRASENYSEGNESAMKGLKLGKQINDNNSIAFAYNRLAAIYYQKNVRFEKYIPSIENENLVKECIKLADTAIFYAQKTNNNDIIISSYSIIGACFREKEEFKSALEVLNKALLMCKSVPDSSYSIYNTPNVLGNMVKVYEKMKEFNKAIELANESMEYSRKRNIIFNNLYMVQTLSGIYEGIGDYKKANEYKTIAFRELQDMYATFTNRTINEIQKRYELENKEQILAANLKTQRYQTLAVLISLIFITTVLIIVVLRGRSIHNKNEIITNQNKELETLNATKDKFFSIIAHDLRNPIHAFKNMLEVLVDEESNFTKEEIHEMIGLLHKNSINLSNLLENLLTWSRSQRGIMPFNLTDVRCNDIIKFSHDSVKQLALDKEISIIEENISNSEKLICDINMINFVLRNLISNAIKFTPKNGNIILRTFRVNDEQVFVVEDTGIGIPEKILINLFDLSNTCSTPGTNNEKGTGLGLVLCNEFINKHHGKIWVESQPGKGSKFYFSIPVTATNS